MSFFSDPSMYDGDRDKYAAYKPYLYCMDYFYTSLDGTHYIEEPTVPLDNTSFDKDMPIFLNCAENQHSNMYGRYVKK